MKYLNKEVNNTNTKMLTENSLESNNSYKDLEIKNKNMVETQLVHLKKTLGHVDEIETKPNNDKFNQTQTRYNNPNDPNKINTTRINFDLLPNIHNKKYLNDVEISTLNNLNLN